LTTWSSLLQGGKFVFTFIKKFFKKHSGSSLDVKTTPLSREHLRRFERPVTNYAPHQLVVGIGQSVGKQRDHNEDSLFCSIYWIVN